MAVSATLITEGNSTTDATNYNTASITAVANRLYLLTVAAGKTTADTNPTVTGGGLGTWTLVEGNQQGTGNQRIMVFRAMSASPGAAAAVNISWGAVTWSNIAWKVIEFTGTVTTGSQGADAIAESVQGDDSGATNVVSLVGVTAGNVTFGCMVCNATGLTLTADTGFTLLGDTPALSTPSNSSAVVWSSTGANPISINSTGTPVTALIGIEIAAATATAHALAGVIAGVSTVPSPAMPVALSLAGATAGVSTATAPAPVLAASLAGVSAGVSTVPAPLLLAAKPLAGVSAGVSTVPAAVMDLLKLLAGVSAGVSTVPAARLDVAMSLAGVSAGVSTVSGSLIETLALAGVSAGVSTATAPLVVAMSLSGVIAALSTAAGALGVNRGLEGVAAGQSSVTGGIDMTIGLAGRIDGVSRLIGDLFVLEQLYFFTPPTVYDGPQISNNESDRPVGQTITDWRLARRLFSHYGPRPVGRSVLKINGVYVVFHTPSQLDIARATEVYLGGHVYTVPASIAAALNAAGFETEVGT